ncbi:MAG: right-handed parallel beta-helix repeat-containing protein [Candidatus Marinimicrobia bacterium]|nr:right-handed parallel beta-helix repeat-containing protein [Candidatus Neomarinimicrobiota bacterium]
MLFLIYTVVLFTLLIPSVSQAYTWTVKQDSSGHYVQIQEAIDISDHGDTVLVSPGVYYENINFNGKNVCLASQYLITEDESYINNTILDGNDSGRVVDISNYETRDAKLIGFTIQHGSIPYLDDGLYVYGAGININDASPSILSCVIKNNNALFSSGGAGIAVLGTAEPYFSGLSIHDNWASRYGGGIAIGINSQPVFDGIEKCSIYNNYAGYDSDIFLSLAHPDDISIDLDTFTVSQANSNLVGLPPTLSFSVQFGYFEAVSHDLYVSPIGDDSNSGISFDQPLKTIQHALTIIESDSLNPKIIHLDEGVFAPSRGQHFPLNLRSQVSLQGTCKSLTTLDGEEKMQLIIAHYDNEYRVSDMGLIHAPYSFVYRTVTVTENINAIYSNLLFTGNSGGVMNMIDIGSEDYPHPQNSSIVLEDLEIIDNPCRQTLYLGRHKSTVFRNSILRHSIPVYDEVWGYELNYPVVISRGLYLDHKDTHLLQNVEISQNDNNGAESNFAASAIHIDGTSVELINCTIVDNSSSLGAAISMYRSKITIVNSILYNNEPNQVWMYNPLGDARDSVIIQNSIIQDNEWGISGYGSNDLHWLENNFDSSPLFQGGVNQPYDLSASSPAIDAGTDFFIWDGDTILNLDPDEYAGLAPDIGAYEYHDPDGIVDHINPKNFELYPNFPNPFNGSTQITFSIPEQKDVELRIFNLKGQQVEYQSFGSLTAGIHHVNWDARGLPSGLYLYGISSGEFKLSRKALLVK